MHEFCKNLTEAMDSNQEVTKMCGAKGKLFEGTPCLFTPRGASYCWYHEEVEGVVAQSGQRT